MNKENENPVSMVAPKSNAQEKLQPIEELAAERAVPLPALAGMSRANGWAEGKQLTGAEFETAMSDYIRKPMGSGRV